MTESMTAKVAYPALPVEVSDMLADYCAETLREWLRANNAPQEAIDLADHLDFYRLYSEWQRSGVAVAANHESAVETLSTVLCALHAMGCKWRTPGGTIPIRHDVLTWAAPAVNVDNVE